MGELMHSCRFIKVAMNSRWLSDRPAEVERRCVSGEFNLPVCVVLRHNPDELVQVVLDLKTEPLT